MITEEFRQRIISSLTDGKSIKHTTGKSVILFPYTTRTGKEVIPEISTKNTFVGSVLRLLCGVKLKAPIKPEDLQEAIVKLVDSEDAKDLKHIVRTVAFDKEGELVPFCEKAFLYVGAGKHDRIEKLAEHFLSVFIDDSSRKVLNDKLIRDSDDLFHRLLLEAFPELVKKKAKEALSHYPAKESLKNAFIKDLSSLCQGEKKLRAQELRKLFTYYLFAHQVEVTLRFNQVLQKREGEHIPMFTMDWEKVSSAREGYVGGWKQIERCREQMFSMAVCSELINQITCHDPKKPIGYSELVELAENLNQDKRKLLTEELGAICEIYRAQITDVPWDEFEAQEPEGVGDYLRNIHRMINFQFQNSSTRKSAAGRYNDWLKFLGIGNFLKFRGRLGYTLNLTRDWFLFLASLCVNTREDGRIRLHDFWGELLLRGIALDYDSKLAAVSLLDRLGLLEKKSDSGDAQYVRSII